MEVKMSNQLLKSLIESMIGDYLEESYEDDLAESIFEEVSEETWEAIEEAILNELSPNLLKRYMKSANKSLNTARSKGMRSAPDGTAKKKYDNIVKKRAKGRYAAGSRLDAYSGNDNPSYMNQADTDARAAQIKKIKNLKKV
jgi:hypothetical protein